MVSVHIVISDRNWILERLASSICDQLDYVTYDTEADPTAQIQYYMTYGCRKERVSACEMGYFAHYEEAPIAAEAREHFWAVANDVDHCICHSRRYEALLRENGVENVTTVPPGVDLDEMAVKVKIGVVGRTYHTGRKGEELVKHVMDIPELEWHFTGTGWPGPAERVPTGKMGDFYNSMDYILVPALYEGGPMCVAEALACGRPVIASPVGWVPDFPHIEFETGNADSLRGVLQGIVDERKALRRSVEHVTWDAWVQGHHAVFQKLGSQLPPRVAEVKNFSFRGPVALCIDAREKDSRGGPTMRIPRTVRELNALGVTASLEDRFDIDAEKYDLVHSFNIWPPQSALKTVRKVAIANKPLVFSPILLDLSERDLFFEAVPRIFETSYSAEDTDRRLAQLRKKRKAEIDDGQAIKEPMDGYFERVKQTVEGTDHLICLSERERQLLEYIGAKPKGGVSIVRNPTDVALFSSGDPELFAQEYGLSDYILCVGRIEARKNQHMLLHALRDSDIPIVLIGHVGDARIEPILEKYIDENVTVIERLEPASPMLLSAYAGARVFVLASWSEGAPLAALEAAAAGCSLVLSDRSSEQEYFGDFARFCDPMDPESIAKAVLEAYANPISDKQRRAQQEHVRENFSWQRYAEDTHKAYERALDDWHEYADQGTTVEAKQTAPPKIYVDVTQSAYHPGPPSGIARVEYMCALELKKAMPDRVVLILRNGFGKVFLQITLEELLDGSFKDYGEKDYDLSSNCNHETGGNFVPYELVEFEVGSILLVMGGAWIRQLDYINDIIVTKRANRLVLVTAIYDVIRAKFGHLYPRKLTDQFIEHVTLLARNSELLLTDSRCAAADIDEFCIKQGIVTPKTKVVRLGDDIKESNDCSLDNVETILELLDGHAFVICVSAIDVRKNHKLLYDIWIRLVEEYGDETPHLICVGAVSWRTEDLRALMSEDARTKDRLHILHDIADSVLDWLYSNCLFTVYPSTYEGWGLPVAESLSYGKVCIAANVSSMPEIAPEFTDLIDPMDFKEWYSAIVRYTFNDTLRAKREEEIKAGYVTTTWEESARAVAEYINQPLAQPEHFPDYSLGTEIYFARKKPESSVDAAPFLAGGWGRIEETGTWMACPSARMGMIFAEAPKSFVLLNAFMSQFPKHPDGVLHAVIHANGQPVGEWHVRRACFKRLLLPMSFANDILTERTAIFDFEALNPVQPSQCIEESKDDRMLGMRFVRLVLQHATTCPVQFGQRIDMATVAQEPESHFHEAGWAVFGDDGILMTGSDAILVLECPQSCETDLLLCLDVGKHSAVEKPFQLEILCNNEKLAQFQFVTEAASELRMLIPRELAAQSECPILTFRVDGAVQSRSIDMETFDSGMRSIVLRNLSLSPVSQVHSVLSPPQYALGDSISFGIDGNASDCILNGWCFPQKNATWTEGENVSLVLTIAADSNGNKGVTLCLLAKALVSHINPALDVDVFVNGECVESWSYADPEITERRAEIPAHVIAKHPAMVLRLKIHDPKSPSELGLGSDQRRLGLLVHSLTLTDLE